MGNLATSKLTDTILKLAELNIYSSVYDFKAEYQQPLNFDIQSDYKKALVQKDFEILQSRIKAHQKIKTPKVGDFLLLPDGQHVIFSHIHEDGQAQTSTGGSMHLSSSGYLSFSGGLDSGLNLEDIEPTKQKKEGLIWFFSQNSSGASRSTQAFIPFRVWKTKEGANLDGIPQIKALKEKIYKEKSEVLTLINGNDQEYKIHLPSVCVISKISDAGLNHIEKKTGLKFVPGYWGSYEAQPLKNEQIVKLLLTYSFSCMYSDGKIILKFCKEGISSKEFYTNA